MTAGVMRRHPTLASAAVPRPVPARSDSGVTVEKNFVPVPAPVLAPVLAPVPGPVPALVSPALYSGVKLFLCFLFR